MNDLIVRKIKEARLERGLTQKDLADHLGKTAAAISDLERGKVQVTAGDLYHIAQLLNKPIEYFYGEEFGDSAIQDLVAIVRKQPPKEQANTIELSRMLMQMQEIGDLAKSIPEGEEMPIEKVKEFYNAFIPFSTIINKMNELINDIRDKFDEELKKRGIDLSN
ncbi:MAG: helix-turn-helix domain-containing protein [Anaerolineales bacterium]|nr:helix-turn-helix domain-containing protein [Anaerolineales bacterium]